MFGFVILTSSSIAVLCAAADNLSWQASEDSSTHEPPSRLIEPRSDPGSLVEYVVRPRDGNNTDALQKTEGFLKQLTQQSSIYSYTDRNGALRLWMVNTTESQVDTIKQNDGVASVDENAIVATPFAAVPAPTEPAKLSEASKAKRETQYATQLNADYELTMISQPP